MAVGLGLTSDGFDQMTVGLDQTSVEKQPGVIIQDGCGWELGRKTQTNNSTQSKSWSMEQRHD